MNLGCHNRSHWNNNYGLCYYCEKIENAEQLREQLKQARVEICAKNLELDKFRLVYPEE